MVQFIHCSDLHLDKSFSTGRISSSIKRKEDLMTRFDEVVDFAITERVQLFFITGDIFDKVLPSNESRNFFAEKLKLLNEQNIQVFLIGGNHDVPKSPIVKPMAIDIFNTVDYATVFGSRNSFQHKSLQLDNTNISIYGKSFDPLDDKSNPFLGLNLQDMSEINIMLIHASYNNNPDLQKFPNKIKYQSFRTVDAEKSDIDYIALGHFHNHFIDTLSTGSIVGNSGSLERFTFREKNEDKGFIFGDITKENIQLNFVPVEARKLEIVKINLDTNITNLTEYITNQLNLLINPELILRIKLNGEITLNQNNELELSSVIRNHYENFFILDIDRTDLAIHEYGKIFLKHFDNPLEAFEKSLKEKIESTKNQKKKDFFEKARRKGLQFFEDIGD